jgi:hypothetical protein
VVDLHRFQIGKALWADDFQRLFTVLLLKNREDFVVHLRLLDPGAQLYFLLFWHFFLL